MRRFSGRLRDLAFARTTPRLRFNAVEPGFSVGTRVVAKGLFPLIAPLIKGSTNPCRAGHVITNAVLNERGETGVYYDERGKPMRGSQLVHDPAFQDRVVTETRSLLEARAVPRRGEQFSDSTSAPRSSARPFSSSVKSAV